LKKFTTIFPFATNVHLIKDVGQVPNCIASKGEYETKLVCFKEDKQFSFLSSEASHLKIDFIEPAGKRLFMEKAVLNYLRENALNIDVLHFFHLTKETIYYSLHYFKCNPNGKVYVKMDVNNEALEKGIRYSKKIIFNKYHKRQEKLFLEKVAVISAENPTALRLLKKRYPTLGDKALLITNGVNDKYLASTFSSIKNFEEKDNIILAVGRIGAKDKNFSLLLHAFSACDLPKWKLVFVGPIENDFEIEVEKILLDKPYLVSRIELIGAVEDRKTLYDYYNNSKICCLTSPFESFGITFVEAMYFGNYVIGTKGMSSLEYITNGFDLGGVIENNDKEALIKILEEVVNDNQFMKRNYHKAIAQVEDKFFWSKIVDPLIDKLSD